MHSQLEGKLDLIPVCQFVDEYRHSHFLTVYIYNYLVWPFSILDLLDIQFPQDTDLEVNMFTWISHLSNLITGSQKIFLRCLSGTPSGEWSISDHDFVLFVAY